jgi:hypothetical protein
MDPALLLDTFILTSPERLRFRRPSAFGRPWQGKQRMPTEASTKKTSPDLWLGDRAKWGQRLVKARPLELWMCGQTTSKALIHPWSANSVWCAWNMNLPRSR